jgi:hypothetical protein
MERAPRICVGPHPPSHCLNPYRNDLAASPFSIQIEGKSRRIAMFGSKKEAKQDLRNGMWEHGPADRNQFGEDRPRRQEGPDIVSPNLHTQAEGQTTHE